MKTLVSALGDIITALAKGAPTNRAELYCELGISLTYPHRPYARRAGRQMAASTAAIVSSGKSKRPTSIPP